ncbi:MAG: hypothetical protein KKI08_25325 [Armatimonadetes bacterium]|nr:hypothetical protein [Armatimonadota bacterium]
MTMWAELTVHEGLLRAEAVATGDIVLRFLPADGAPVNVSLTAHTGLDGRWARPRLLTGPDGVPWLLALNVDRRHVFAFRWLEEALAPAHEARSLFHIQWLADNSFEENLAPLQDYAAEVADTLKLTLRPENPALAPVTHALPARQPTVAAGGVLAVDLASFRDLRGVRWVVNRASKHSANPLVMPGQPGDPDDLKVFNRGCVLRDGGLFRMWYTCANNPRCLERVQRQYAVWQDIMRVGYAESEDGLHWRKPKLGLVEYDGSRDNNIVPNLWRLPCIVRTDRSPVAGEPYVTTEQERQISDERALLQTSADGIHWNLQPAHRSYPRSRPWYFEQDCLFYDESAGLWRGYGSYGTGPKRRTSGMLTSPDLVAWEGHAENPVVDPLQMPEWHLHDMVVWQEGGMYVGLLQVARCIHADEFALVISHDGVHFSRPDPTGLFLQSGNAGEWDPGYLLIAAAPVQVGEEWWLYYGGAMRDLSREPYLDIYFTRIACGLATFRRGGYAHFEAAGAAPGHLTLPLPKTETPLRLSVNASGAVRAEVLGAEGQALPGYGLGDCLPTAGDGLALPLRWRGHEAVAPRGGGARRLRVELSGDARLYGINWR